MKKNQKITIIGLLILLNFSLRAQVTLPYFTGFDDTSQQAGWTEFQKAEVSFCHWYMASNIGHSFAPSSGINVVDNWMVSPPFSIINGGKLDSIRFMFSGFSNPVSGDTIAIYLLNGSQDPSLANSKQLIFDFRGNEYIIDDTFRIKTNIILPSQNGLSYLAIRYRNSQCSYNWITVCFDNIAISGNSMSVKETEESLSKIKIYPNPARNQIKIEALSNSKHKLEIYNLTGQLLMTDVFSNKISIDISDLHCGVYFLRIQSENKIIIRKLIKE